MPPTIHQTAIISGAGRWLGKYLAGRLLSQGTNVAMLARNVEELTAAAAEVQALAIEGARALAVPCDITDQEQVRAAVAATERELGPVDLLINNASASAGLGRPFLELTPGDFGLALGTNVYGAVHLSQAVLPGMLERGRGAILNMSYGVGRRGAANAAPSSTAKFALHGLGESMAREFRGQGIHVATLIINGGIDNDKSRGRVPESGRVRLIDMDEIGRSIDYLLAQHPRGWTHELTITPNLTDW